MDSPEPDGGGLESYMNDWIRDGGWMGLIQNHTLDSQWGNISFLRHNI